MVDMIDRPGELLALIDVVTKFAIKDTIAGCKGKAVPYVWFWLHKVQTALCPMSISRNSTGLRCGSTLPRWRKRAFDAGKTFQPLWAC
jgi:hypothetical protein